MVPALPDFGHANGTVLVVGSSILAALTITATISERLRGLLGPLGKWIATRNERATRRQMETENLVSDLYEQRTELLLSEVEFYKTRYEATLKELEQWRDPALPNPTVEGDTPHE